MVRLRYAALAALLLVAGWLIWLAYVANWHHVAFYESLGEAALSWRLMGLAAVCYTQAADLHRAQMRYSAAVGDEAGEELSRQEVVRVRMIVARILLAAERPHAALHFAQQAHRADPKSIGAAALMWRVRHATGMTAAARRELMLLGLRAPAPEVLTALGEMFVSEGRAEQAADFATRAIEKASRSAEAWLVLARAHARDGHHEEARRAAEKAIECAVAQPVTRVHAGQLHLKLHPDSSQWLLGDRGLDYWWQLVATRVQEHVSFAVGLAGYLMFLLSPAIASALGLRRLRQSRPVSANSAVADSSGDS
jgi:tetratricopeptide (TPR) repeat protein